VAPYNASPAVNTPVKLLQPGVTGYAFGSYDSEFPTTLMQVTNVSLTGNFATILVQLREGAIPTTDGLITIRGTTVAGGVFNVKNVAVEVVNFDPVTGIGSISFILVNADVPSAPDNGMAYVPVPEVGELLPASGSQSSQAFAIQDIAGHNENGLTLQWSTTYPSAPSGVTMTLECADFDIDSEYVQVDSSNDVGGDNRSITLTRFRFVRVTASGVSGGSSPSAIVRLGI
jgi:hypothetical protein